MTNEKKDVATRVDGPETLPAGRATAPTYADHRVPWVKNDTAWGAFVAGAKWWEFTKTGGTMWASDRDAAWEEAERRYGPLPEDTTPYDARLTEVEEGKPCGSARKDSSS